MAPDGRVPSPAAGPVISIIIPTLNSASTLERALAPIRSSLTSGWAEAIVADGGSTDDTAIIARRNGARVIESSDKSTARNEGAAAAGSERLLFLDSDMEPSEALLRECVAKLGSFDALAIREVVISDNYWGRARGLERASFYGTLTWEANRVYRRDVFNQLGGYDPRWGSSFEDMALQFSLLEAGVRVGWVDTSVFHHEEGVGFFNYIQKRRKLGLAKFIQEDTAQWRAFLSPMARLRRVLGYVKATGRWRNLGLVPGLVLLRTTELAVRRH